MTRIGLMRPIAMRDCARPLYVAEFQFRYNNRKSADLLTSIIASLHDEDIQTGEQRATSFTLNENRWRIWNANVFRWDQTLGPRNISNSRFPQAAF
jgi:hypothetical protein